MVMASTVGMAGEYEESIDHGACVGYLSRALIVGIMSDHITACRLAAEHTLDVEGQCSQAKLVSYWLVRHPCELLRLKKFLPRTQGFAGCSSTYPT